MRDLELGGNSMDANEVERSGGEQNERSDEGKGIRMPRVVNSTDLFGGSSFRVSAVAKGERALQRPIMAIAAVGEVTRDTRGEKGTA